MNPDSIDDSIVSGETVFIGIEFYECPSHEVLSVVGEVALHTVASFLHYALEQRGLAVFREPACMGWINHGGAILALVNDLKEALPIVRDVLVRCKMERSAAWGYYDVREIAWRAIECRPGVFFGQRLDPQKLPLIVEQYNQYYRTLEGHLMYPETGKEKE